jgi:hypothetical protein
LSFRTLVGRTLLAFAVAFGSRVAHAEPQLFVELDYRPDAELACPGETAFKAMVSDQLGYDPFRLGAEQKVVARTLPAERGLRGVIEWSDASGNPRGERELGSEISDCGALARAMSFAIVVQIQLLAQEAESAGAATADQASSDDASATNRAASPPVTAPRQARDTRGPSAVDPSEREAPLQFLLGAGPALAFGLAPRTVVEGRVFGALRSGRVAFELGGEASLWSRHETADGSGFEQHVLSGSVAGCLLFGRFSGCLVSKVGGLYVRGFGVDVPNSDSGILVQTGPRLMLLQAFGQRWLGALRVEALASLHTWEVTLNDEEVWKTPLFSLSVGGDVALSFQ